MRSKKIFSTLWVNFLYVKSHDFICEHITIKQEFGHLLHEVLRLDGTHCSVTIVFFLIYMALIESTLLIKH